MVPTPRELQEGYALLERRIRGTAFQKALLAVVFLAAGVVVLAAGVSSGQRHLDAKAAFVGVMGATFLWAAWVTFATARSLWPATQSRVYRSVRSGAKDLAWAHPTGGSVSGLKVHFLDGQTIMLYASPQQSETLIYWLQAQAPHAVFGFGAEQQRAYAQAVAASRRRP